MLSGLKVLGKDEVKDLAKAEEKERKKREKKEKKEKKKKEKKSKHEKKDKHGGGGRGGGASSSDNSDGSDDESSRAKRQRVSKGGDGGKGGGAEPAAAPAKREDVGMDWMSNPSLARKAGDRPPKEVKDTPEEEKERLKKESDERMATRQLNPYFKDGGAGLPPDAAAAAAAGARKPPGVGDGGASWRLKALKRAQQRAAEEGRSLDAEVQERWGSLAQLTNSITTEKSAHAQAHKWAARDRARAAEGAGSGAAPGEGRLGEKRSYLNDVRSEKTETKSSMRKPDESRTLSWRREGPSGRGRDGGRDGRDRDVGRGRERERDAPRGACYNCGKDGHLSRDCPDPRKPRDADGKAGACFNCGGEGHMSRDCPEPRKERGGGRGDGDERAPPRRLGDDGGALKAAAEGINKFDSSGNFMDQFLAQSGGGGGGGAGAPEGGAGASTPREYMAPAAPRAPAAAAPGEAMNPNKLMAQAMKAKLMGKLDEAARLEALAKEARNTEVVVIPQVDARGRAAPGALGRAGATAFDAADMRKEKRTQRYDGGQKERWFKDDDKHDLDSLVREARHGGAGDMDRHAADNISRKAKYKGNEFDADEEYDNDGGLEMFSDRSKRGSGKDQSDRERKRQVSDARRLTTIQDKCQLCFDNPKKPKHLIVAIGMHAYLMLPTHGSLVAGHCWLVTCAHDPGSRMVEEETWDELRNFKKCLIQMYANEGKEAIFLETVMGLDSQRGHCMIECVPVMKEVAEDAPVFFKQALDEAESEWSVHNAKKIISTRVKGLRGSIPEHFPYFHVEFGLADGYAHIIDEEGEWKRDFGRNVLIGIMDLPEEDMYRRGRKKSEVQQRREVEEFVKKWQPYDWTKMLK